MLPGLATWEADVGESLEPKHLSAHPGYCPENGIQCASLGPSGDDLVHRLEACRGNHFAEDMSAEKFCKFGCCCSQKQGALELE